MKRLNIQNVNFLLLHTHTQNNHILIFKPGISAEISKPFFNKGKIIKEYDDEEIKNSKKPFFFISLPNTKFNFFFHKKSSRRSGCIISSNDKSMGIRPLHRERGGDKGEI